MCRFTLYLGPPVRLSSLLTEPQHSLIHQSYHSREREEPLNGDGFGVGWFAPRLTWEPAVYHDVSPAWNNRNLKSIAKVVTSPCILAHVRAATPGSEVNLANCHPFQYGAYLLMHNGHIGGFRKVRRRLLEELTEEAFDVVRGSTDTEHLFALFVDEIVRHGCPIHMPPKRGGESVTDGPVTDPPLELANRLHAAVRRVMRLVEEHGDDAPSMLNVAVSDGVHAAVCRFSDSPDGKPESLYFRQGEVYEPAGRMFEESRRDDEEGEAYLVSSERLTDDPGWGAVPPNHMVVLSRKTEARVLAMTEDGLVGA
jgi:predicted glutamine amidotransferase